jgi:hypothetical protein
MQQNQLKSLHNPEGIGVKFQNLESLTSESLQETALRCVLPTVKEQSVLILLEGKGIEGIQSRVSAAK